MEMAYDHYRSLAALDDDLTARLERLASEAATLQVRAERLDADSSGQEFAMLLALSRAFGFHVHLAQESLAVHD